MTEVEPIVEPRAVLPKPESTEDVQRGRWRDRVRSSIPPGIGQVLIATVIVLLFGVLFAAVVLAPALAELRARPSVRASSSQSPSSESKP